MEAPHITYLFGAGASAYTMPTFEDLPERIGLARQFIESNYSFGSDDRITVKNGVEVQKEVVKEVIIRELDHLTKQAGRQATIDTYAKTLWLQGRETDFTKLRFFLSLFFGIEQKRMGTDLRYQNFFVSLLSQHSFRFPSQIKFLSWNYDLQMEAAFEEIAIRGGHNISFDVFNSENFELTKDGFNSVKLNGASYWRENGNLVPIIKHPFSQEVAPDDLDYAMLYVYHHFMSNAGTWSRKLALGFSWLRSSNTLHQIRDVYDQTKILVVIGYSFPFFNREVDRTIIRAMKLDKVYIQNPRAEEVKQSFISILPDKPGLPIELLTAKSKQFFLPPEL